MAVRNSHQNTSAPTHIAAAPPLTAPTAPGDGGTDQGTDDVGRGRDDHCPEAPSRGTERVQAEAGAAGVTPKAMTYSVVGTTSG